MKFTINKEKILVFLILLLAFFLRVYKLAEYPAGLNADEAAIGYNAFSLLQTGKDEFGHPWPINFQSFNDFKPGLYFYLVLPFVKILGLNELAVRLPSAFLGTLTVLLVYLLIKQMQFSTNSIAVASSLLLAISPWHLHFSRGGWESNAALFFITLGVYLFFLSLKSPKNFALCILTFELSMYTYHSARVIAPFLLIGLFIFYRRRILTLANRKHLVIAVIVGILLLSPLVKLFMGNEGTSRFAGVGLLADQGPIWRANEQRGQHVNIYSSPSKLLHNKYLEYTFAFFKNYLKHFNGNFLFIMGDEIQRNKVPEMGQMYLIEVIFLVLGIYFLLKNKPEHWRFLFWWLAIAPIASALTFQSPHAIRSLNMVIPLMVITAYGIIGVFALLKNKRTISVFVCGLTTVLYLWNFSFYLHEYYVHYPQTYPAAWEYGFKDLVSYVINNQGKYNNIYITDKYDQPYILFAFYLKYPPLEFQKEAKLTERDNFGFSTVDHFGKYYFGKIDLSKNKFDGKSLIIGTPEEIPESATIMRRIYFKDGKTEAFRIIEL